MFRRCPVSSLSIADQIDAIYHWAHFKSADLSDKVTSNISLSVSNNHPRNTIAELECLGPRCMFDTFPSASTRAKKLPRVVVNTQGQHIKMVLSRKHLNELARTCAAYTCTIVIIVSLIEQAKVAGQQQQQSQNGSLDDFATSSFNLSVWDSVKSSMEDTSSSNSSSSRANESAILDDLVKQFLERSFSADANESVMIANNTITDRMYPKPTDGNSGSGERPQAFMQLLSGDQVETSTTEPNQGELMDMNAYEDDRHIPYDVVQPAIDPAVELENGNYGDNEQHVKRMVDAQQQAEVDQTNNLTISIVRNANEQEQATNQSTSTRASNQARAMGRSSFSQISRPPYATYDHQIQPTSPVPSQAQQHKHQVDTQSEKTSANRDGIPNLVQSVNKISTHLATTADGEDQPAHLQAAGNEEDAKAERLVAAEREKSRQHQALADQVSRLSPINQPISLNPIEMSAAAPGDLAENQGKLHTMLSPSSKKPVSSGDRYETMPSMYFNNLRDTSSNSLIDSLQRNNLNDQTNRGQLTGVQFDPEPNNDLQRPTGTHPASLVNITGPLTPPLSATNAMEASLGAEGAKAGLIHQASGFSRSKQPSVVPMQVTDSKLTTRKTSPSPSAASNVSNLSYFSSKPLDERLEEERLRLDGSSYLPAIGRSPQLAANTHQASGFRSPYNQFSGSSYQHATPVSWATTTVPLPSSYLSSSQSAALLPASALNSLPSSNRYPQSGAMRPQQAPGNSSTTNGFITSSSSNQANNLVDGSTMASTSSSSVNSLSSSTSTSTATSSSSSASALSASPPSSSASSLSSSLSSTPTSTIASISSTALSQPGVGFGSATMVSGGGASSPTQQQLSSQQQQTGLNKRVFNLTRVEHISAECSNDLIRTLIIFNGTFKGIIYSSGYVRDPSCLYINGTGKTRYDFSIRLNQCGTLGRQEVHPGSANSDFRRRDQVMWNTLSIQYNPIIEQEWDEHFRVSCEYGSDFWKTISFSPFNVETNTGSPVVFTVDPPQCNMEILRGHGMVGERQEASSGPVTVGDPLTLLIHMRSERAGYDILVKNCVAHNGGTQKMALIDQQGCVVNERFLSPFRGTFSGDDYKHVTLYSYLKAFRFTGSPVLYLECEIHMCQSSCPPQMCYWRRLSKRSTNSSTPDLADADQDDFLTQVDEDSDDDADNDKLPEEATDQTGSEFITSLVNANSRGRVRSASTTTERPASKVARRTARKLADKKEPLSGNMTLYGALEVRQERDPKQDAPYSLSQQRQQQQLLQPDPSQLEELLDEHTGQLRCFRRGQVYGFLFTGISILLAAFCVTLGCCWRASTLRRRLEERKLGSMLAAVSSANHKRNFRSATSIYSTAGGSSASSLSAGAPTGDFGAHCPSYLATCDAASQPPPPPSRYKDRPLLINY